MTPKCGQKGTPGVVRLSRRASDDARRGVGSFPWLVRLLQTAYPVGIHFVEWSPSAACRGQAGCIRDDGHGGRSSDSRRPSPSAALPRPREIPQHGAPRAAGCHEMRRRATAPSASSRMWEAAIHNPFSLPSGGTPRGAASGRRDVRPGCQAIIRGMGVFGDPDFRQFRRGGSGGGGQTSPGWLPQIQGWFRRAREGARPPGIPRWSRRKSRTRSRSRLGSARR